MESNGYYIHNDLLESQESLPNFDREEDDSLENDLFELDRQVQGNRDIVEKLKTSCSKFLAKFTSHIDKNLAKEKLKSIRSIIKTLLIVKNCHKPKFIQFVNRAIPIIDRIDMNRSWRIYFELNGVSTKLERYMKYENSNIFKLTRLKNQYETLLDVMMDDKINSML
jgi:hypothetical protein